jgi:hypothetical protein
VEGVKAYAKIGKISGQADSFKVRVESPLCHFIVCQGIDDFLRDMFSLCKVNDLHLVAIDRITEQQDFKVRRLRVFVNAALVQVDVGEGFYIYTDVFQLDHLNSNRRPKIAPKPPAGTGLFQGFHTLDMVFVVLRGFFLLALLTLEVVNHRLDGDHSPRQNYDAEASDQDVTEKG